MSDNEMIYDFGKDAWWNMNIHLAGVIAAGMKLFIDEDRNGIPGPYFENYPLEPTAEQEKEALKEWEYDLRKVHKAFQVYYDREAFFADCTEDEAKEVMDGIELFPKVFHALWD